MSITSSWSGSRASSFPRSRGAPDRRTWRKTQDTAPRVPSPLRGELLIELQREDISKSPCDSKIRDCSYIASYSWLDGTAPAVLIPGKPPAWTRPAVDRRLDPDKGEFFRDPNAARYPTYPMEPAVQAVLKQCPQFPTRDVDIVTCTSALGNLARFVRGVEKEFRIILVKVGNTVFLIRRENSPQELIPNVRGYGHTFPEEYTSWEKDVKRSSSHQRIIQYWFGGLQLLVRFEVDGYFRDKDGRLDPPLEPSSLVDAFGSTSVGHAIVTGQRCLQIKEGGQPISQESIFDIKTRSAFDFKTRTIKKEIDMTDIIPRLWISQIPTLIVGFHDRGLFEDIRVQDMREEIKEWEADNAESLQQLASLLHELVELAGTSRTKLEICRSESGPLEIRRLADEDLEALPSELRARWVGEPKGDEEASPQRDTDPDAESDLGDQGLDSDDESVKDYTACSLEECGYCGHCTY